MRGTTPTCSASARSSPQGSPIRTRRSEQKGRPKPPRLGGAPAWSASWTRCAAAPPPSPRRSNSFARWRRSSARCARSSPSTEFSGGFSAAATRRVAVYHRLEAGNLSLAEYGARRLKSTARWTDERVDLLKKLWADGLSGAQIAQELGGVSRNGVIGKAHRLGLTGRREPRAPRAPRRSLLELTDATCRWPVGDPQHPEFFFCGAPPRANSPYCAAHWRRGL